MPATDGTDAIDYPSYHPSYPFGPTVAVSGPDHRLSTVDSATMDITASVVS